MGEEDSSSQSNAKPIRVSGNLKKSYFSESVQSDSDSGEKSSSN